MQQIMETLESLNACNLTFNRPPIHTTGEIFAFFPPFLFPSLCVPPTFFEGKYVCFRRKCFEIQQICSFELAELENNCWVVEKRACASKRFWNNFLLFWQMKPIFLAFVGYLSRICLQCRETADVKYVRTNNKLVQHAKFAGLKQVDRYYFAWVALTRFINSKEYKLLQARSISVTAWYPVFMNLIEWEQPE